MGYFLYSHSLFFCPQGCYYHRFRFAWIFKAFRTIHYLWRFHLSFFLGIIAKESLQIVRLKDCTEPAVVLHSGDEMCILLTHWCVVLHWDFANGCAVAPLSALTKLLFVGRQERCQQNEGQLETPETKKALWSGDNSKLRHLARWWSEVSLESISLIFRGKFMLVIPMASSRAANCINNCISGRVLSGRCISHCLACSVLQFGEGHFTKFTRPFGWNFLSHW